VPGSAATARGQRARAALSEAVEPHEPPGVVPGPAGGLCGARVLNWAFLARLGIVPHAGGAARGAAVFPVRPFPGCLPGNRPSKLGAEVVTQASLLSQEGSGLPGVHIGATAGEIPEPLEHALVGGDGVRDQERENLGLVQSEPFA
jgi:hypothetical protein